MSDTPPDKPNPLTPPEVADVLRTVELRAGYIIGTCKDVREMRLEAEEIKRQLAVAFKGLRDWWHAPQSERCPKCNGDQRGAPCAYPEACAHPCRTYIAERNQALLAAASAGGMKVTDEMVDRFLSWSLPKDFAPDCGISFSPPKTPHPIGYWPIGTNLFTADQARQMLEHLLAPSAASLTNSITRPAGESADAQASGMESRAAAPQADLAPTYPPEPDPAVGVSGKPAAAAFSSSEPRSIAVLRGVSNLLRRCLRHGLLRAETEAMLLDIEAALNVAPTSSERAQEALPELGGTYVTQGGETVKMVGIANVGTHMESLADEDGCHRYSRRPADAGRVTGSPHDYSEPRNLKRPIRALKLECAASANRSTIIRECCAALDMLYERGPGRGELAWRQAWGSGVLDAAELLGNLDQPEGPGA